MKRFQNIFLALTIFLWSGAYSYAQYNKTSVRKLPDNLNILQVDYRESSTIVYLQYKDTDEEKKSVKKTFSRVTQNSDIEDGGNYILVFEPSNGSPRVLTNSSDTNGNFLGSTMVVSYDDINKIVIDDNTNIKTNVTIKKTKASDNGRVGYSLKMGNSYISETSMFNYNGKMSDCLWLIDVEKLSDPSPISSISNTIKYLQFNPTDSCFIIGNGSKHTIALYKEITSSSLEISESTKNIIKKISNGSCIFDKTYAKVSGSSRRYNLINSINMPISTEAEQQWMLFDGPNKEHRFALEFEKMPVGSAFSIIEDENNPLGYNCYDISVDTTQITNYVDLDEMVFQYPISKIRGYYIKNDVSIQYVKANDIILTMYAHRIKQYGKYYNINMDLQNFSGKSILFSPNKIHAECITFDKKGEVKKTYPKVFSVYDYDKKIMKKQRWQNFWESLGQVIATAGAGYESSSTSYSGNSFTSMYGSTHGYVGNTYGYARAYGSAYTTTFGRSHTTTYNGYAAYAAHQQASENISNFKLRQYEIRQQLNDGYIKNNTINNEMEYSGYFNIEYKKADRLLVNVIIDDIVFPFIF